MCSCQTWSRDGQGSVDSAPRKSNPEILPEDAKARRPDAIIATGRSDYPNQVNNVLCFPFFVRGALDVGATTINEDMKLAAVRAIADLARRDVSMWWRPSTATSAFNLDLTT